MPRLAKTVVIDYIDTQQGLPYVEHITTIMCAKTIVMILSRLATNSCFSSHHKITKAKSLILLGKHLNSAYRI